MPMNEVRPALLVLADGTLFEGEAIGAEAPGGVVSGEVVFNTASTGYQEILTDTKVIPDGKPDGGSGS